MAATYHFQILTPQGKAYEADIVHAQVRADDGFVGVLANHAAFVTSCPGGRLEVREAGGNEKKFQTGPGFFEVAKNQAVLLTQSFSVESAPSH